MIMMPLASAGSRAKPRFPVCDSKPTMTLITTRYCILLKRNEEIDHAQPGKQDVEESEGEIDTRQQPIPPPGFQFNVSQEPVKDDLLSAVAALFGQHAGCLRLK